MRAFLGYDLHENTPDHLSLSIIHGRDDPMQTKLLHSPTADEGYFRVE